MAVRVLGEGLGVDVLGDAAEEEQQPEDDEDDEDEAAPVANAARKKQVVDLTGATVYNQGWNATLDPEGTESGRFIAVALEVLQTLLAKEESESAETIALLDSTIQLLNTPPSAGLGVKAMTEFMRLSKRFVKHLDAQGKAAPPLLADKSQQQISFVARKKAVAASPAKPAQPAKDKEEQVEEPLDEEVPEVVEEEAAPVAAAAADDGEAKPMDTGMEEEDLDSGVPVLNNDEEEQEDDGGVPVLDEEADADEIEPIKANDEESDTGGSDAEGAEDADVNADAEQEEQEAKDEQEAIAQAEAEEQEDDPEEGLEGSAAEATKDKIPAAKPDEEEELVDENPSPSAASQKKRERDEQEEADGDEEDEDLVVVEEPVVAPSPSKKAAVQKVQAPAPLIAAVIQNRRIHSVYESEEAARVGVSNVFTPKAGQTIDTFCTFRPLPAHWKTFLSVKMALEPVVENLPKIENIALLWPDLTKK